MKKYLELPEKEFWEIEVIGTRITVCYGKIGTKGQKKGKTYPSKEAALKAAKNMIFSKITKGYYIIEKSSDGEVKKMIRGIVIDGRIMAVNHMNSYLEFQDDNSHKFYEIDVDFKRKIVTITSGRIKSSGKDNCRITVKKELVDITKEKDPLFRSRDLIYVRLKNGYKIIKKPHYSHELDRSEIDLETLFATTKIDMTLEQKEALIKDGIEYAKTDNVYMYQYEIEGNPKEDEEGDIEWLAQNDLHLATALAIYTGIIKRSRGKHPITLKDLIEDEGVYLEIYHHNLRDLYCYYCYWGDNKWGFLIDSRTLRLVGICSDGAYSFTNRASAELLAGRSNLIYEEYSEEEKELHPDEEYTTIKTTNIKYVFAL